MKKVYQVEGMSCAHCVARVENALKEITGVKKAKVNLKKANAVVKYDEQVATDEMIINAVAEAGYTATIA
jgi:copper chaperone